MEGGRGGVVGERDVTMQRTSIQSKGSRNTPTSSHFLLLKLKIRVMLMSCYMYVQRYSCSLTSLQLTSFI